MPPPDPNAEGPEPESEDAKTPETNDAVSPARPEVPDVARSGTDRARERKIQRQRRMKQAWRNLVESFDEVFYNSDEDEDGAEPDQYYRRRSPPRGYIDDSPRYPPPPGARYRPYEPSIRSTSQTPSPGIDGAGTAPVEPIVEAAAPAPPISYVTELYDYSEATRRGDYEEAYLKSTFEKTKPADVFHTRGADGIAAQGLVFKLTSMYAIPPVKKRRKNRYDEASDDMAGEDLLRHAEEKLGVLAELGTYMTIHSQPALKALRFIIPSHPDLPRLSETVTVPEPYCFVVQFKKEIDQYIAALPALPTSEPAATRESTPAATPVLIAAINGESTTAQPTPRAPAQAHLAHAELTQEQEQRQDLQILMDHVVSSNDFGRKYEAEIALHAQKKCTFELAWMLFRPGKYVYSWEGDSLNCFVVDSFELEGLFAKRTKSSQAEVRPRNRLRGQEYGFSRVPESIVVKLCYLEFDGEFIGRRPKKVVISAFEGEKNINELPVYPEEYCTVEKTRETLITRGKKYLELTKRTYAEYDGETLSIPQRSIKSRIMIDSRTFYNDRDSGLTKVSPSRGIIDIICSFCYPVSVVLRRLHNGRGIYPLALSRRLDCNEMPKFAIYVCVPINRVITNFTRSG